jgi:hypothetical protein
LRGINIRSTLEENLGLIVIAVKIVRDGTEALDDFVFHIKEEVCDRFAHDVEIFQPISTSPESLPVSCADSF